MTLVSKEELLSRREELGIHLLSLLPGSLGKAGIASHPFLGVYFLWGALLLFILSFFLYYYSFILQLIDNIDLFIFIFSLCTRIKTLGWLLLFCVLP
jgi:hypothetical protein